MQECLNYHKESLEDLAVELERLTFDQFKSTQQQWLRNISILWLIQGHLTENDALKIVDLAENSIEFNRINESDVSLNRCVKLKDRTVYEFERSNKNPRNPNSCIKVIHSYEIDSDRDKNAVAHVLASLLH